MNEKNGHQNWLMDFVRDNDDLIRDPSSSAMVVADPGWVGDLDRLSAEIEEKRAEAVRLQNEVAAEHLRCEAIAKDFNKLQKMLG
jgi:hypothetical protein